MAKDKHGPKIPIKNDPNRSNWVEKAGGLPEYIESIAEHLKGKNPSWPDGRCIAVAVNTVKRWCKSGSVTEGGKGGGGGVTAKTKAKACAAVAQWEAKKASTKTNLSMEPGGKDRLIQVEGLLILSSDLQLAQEFTVRTAFEREYDLALAQAREDEAGWDWRTQGNGKRSVTLKDGSSKIVNGKQYDELVGQGKLPKPRKEADKPGGSVLGYGSTNRAAVEQVQTRLADMGYEIAPDGVWGDQTEGAIRKFQKEHGLQVDGILGEKTLGKMSKSRGRTNGRQGSADPSMNAVMRVVSPAASKTLKANRKATLNAQKERIKAHRERESQAFSESRKSSRAKTTRGAAIARTQSEAIKQRQEAIEDAPIDPETGKKIASSKTGPIGSTTPHQPNDPEFEKQHPRKGGKFTKKTTTIET